MKRRINIVVVGMFLAAVLLVFLVSPRNRQRMQSGFLTVISPFLGSTKVTSANIAP